MIVLGSIGLGGGLYETLLVDPKWPSNPAIAQPSRGGISRGRFWVPIHTLYELALDATHLVAYNAAFSRPARLRFKAQFSQEHTRQAYPLSLFDRLPVSNAFENLIPRAKGPDDQRELCISRLNPLQHVVIDVVSFLVMILEVAKPHIRIRALFRTFVVGFAGV